MTTLIVLGIGSCVVLLLTAAVESVARAAKAHPRDWCPPGCTCRPPIRG